MGFTKCPESVRPKLTLTKDLDQVIELFTSSTITSCVNVPFILVNLAVIYLIGGSIVIVPVVIATLIFINCLVSYLRINLRQSRLKLQLIRQVHFSRPFQTWKPLNQLAIILTLKSGARFRLPPKKSLKSSEAYLPPPTRLANILLHSIKYP